MRLAVLAIAVLAAATAQAAAQSDGVPAGPKVGEFEIKAYQKIPKAKSAVQLTSDTHLSRELRRQVMIRLSQRGNEVGFSGGNVMRMDVTYFDLNSGGQSGGGTIGGQPSYAEPGANPRMELPSNPIRRRDTISPQASPPTLRINLTLYSVDGGKVLWAATGSCATSADRAKVAGEAIINRIFDNADKSLTGDAGCPF
ncbi:MAG: hypothetical protein FJX11_12395 [Alphaproteobacteria bacterium]|nr:hypothetical protein [Alphaproteobacteria bacterium]